MYGEHVSITAKGLQSFNIFRRRCRVCTLICTYLLMGNNGVTNDAISIAVGETSGKASKGVAKYSAGAGMAQAEQRAGGAMSEIGKAKQVGAHRILLSYSSSSKQICEF